MLTLESGEPLLMENGDALALESGSAPVVPVVANRDVTAWYNGQAAGSDQYKNLDAVRGR